MTTETESGRRVGPDNAFAEVPGKILEHPALGPVAVRIWGYSWWRLGLKKWILRKADICKRCRIGEHAWKKAIKELTAADLYRLERGSFEAGQKNDQDAPIGGQKYVVHVFYWPGTLALDSPDSLVAAAPPKVPGRLTAHSVSAGRPTVARVPGGDRKKRNKRNIEAEEAPPSPSAPQKRAEAVHTAKKPPIKRPSGIWCAADRPDDPAEAEEIESTCTAAEIEAAVEDVRTQLTEAGKARWPTPGPVRDSILRARIASQTAKRILARGTGCSPPVPVSVTNTLQNELAYLRQLCDYGQLTEAEFSEKKAAVQAKFCAR
ncbi:MAG: hypothetical protein RSP_20840 [Rhodanobacter sp.]